MIERAAASSSLTEVGATKRTSLSSTPTRRNAPASRPTLEQQRLHLLVRAAGAARPRSAPRRLSPTPSAAGRARTRAGAAGAAHPRRGRRGAGLRPRRTHADRYRIRRGAQLVRPAAALLAGHPARIPGHDAASRPSSVIAALYVTNGRPSEAHVRTPSSAAARAVRGRPRQARPRSRRRAAGRSRARSPAYTDLRAHHDPREARRDDRLGARRRPPGVDARLERHVERRAVRTLARGLERERLGVRQPGPLVPALPHHFAVRDDDRADEQGLGLVVPRPSSASSIARSRCRASLTRSWTRACGRRPRWTRPRDDTPGDEQIGARFAYAGDVPGRDAPSSNWFFFFFFVFVFLLLFFFFFLV